MTRKKVTLDVKGEDFSLEPFSDEEKADLLTLIEGDPLLLNLYALRELMTIRKRLGPEQWTQLYEFRLDVARSNELIDEFPTRGQKFLYVHSCSGVVTLNFDTRSEPLWTLTTRDLYRIPFERIHLGWAAQADKKLIFYVSNQRILRSTLA
jgi:hypothetical protein